MRRRLFSFVMQQRTERCSWYMKAQLLTFLPKTGLHVFLYDLSCWYNDLCGGCCWLRCLVAQGVERVSTCCVPVAAILISPVNMFLSGEAIAVCCYLCASRTLFSSSVARTRYEPSRDVPVLVLYLICLRLSLYFGVGVSLRKPQIMLCVIVCVGVQHGY